jgi:CP12 domain
MKKVSTWFVSWFLKRFSNKTTKPKQMSFQKYCEENPWAIECRIHDV